jgi:membrane-bound lytic murein transglycosylase A
MSRPEQPLQEINSQSVELERDDLSRELLVQAVQNSLLYYERLPGDRLVKFGPEEIPVSRMKRTLETFLELLAESYSWTELADRVREKFIIYRSVGRNVEQEVLFTGYYEPTIQGSLTQDDHYRLPIYGVPDDLLKIDLGLFGKQYKGTRLVGRTEGNRVVPYYSRDDIEFDGKLAGKGYELVWVADPVERFFSGGTFFLAHPGFRAHSVAGRHIH